MKVAFYTLLHKTISLLFPIKNKKLLFSSFLGVSYSDNPRAISEKIHEIDPNWEIVWVFKNKKKKNKILPSYIKCTKTNSLSFFYHQATSKFWVDNFCLPRETRKRKGQYYIQLWHGDRAMKKILCDASTRYDENELFETHHCDLVVSGSKFFEDICHSAFRYYGEILKVGCPRNDIIISGDVRIADSLRKLYGIPKNVKVLLYAPTFRDNNPNDYQTVEDVDFNKVLDHLREKTQQEWIILLRGHSGRRIAVDDSIKAKTINVSDYEDARHIMLITDALITDYSSIAGDYALAAKPIFLFVNDYKEYTENSRELYFDIFKSPYWVAKNQDELLDLIDNCTEDKAKDNCKKILDFYQTYETGKASEEVCKFIIQHSAEHTENSGTAS